MKRLISNLKFTYKYFNKYKIRIIINLFLDMLVTILSLLTPLFVMYLLDVIIIENKWEELPIFIGVFVGITIFAHVLSFVSNYIFVTFTEGVYIEARHELFKDILSKKLAFFLDYSVGDLSSRVMKDSGQMPSLYAYLLSKLVTNLIKILVVFYILFSMNIGLALLTVISVPFFLGINHILRKKLYTKIKNVKELNSKIENYYIDCFSKIKTVKNYTLERNLILKNEVWNSEAKSMQVDCENMGYLVQSIMGIVTAINQLVVIIVGAFCVFKGIFSVGMLVAYNSYLSYVYAPFMQIIATYNEFVSTEVSLERYREISEERRKEDWNEGRKLDEEIATIEFRHLTFSYDKEKILENCNWECQKNAKILIKGKSGQGKSTFAIIMKGLYQIDEGEILINNQSISNYCLIDIRKKIKYLSQEQDFFDGTIRDNFRIYRNDITDKEIWDLLEYVRLKEIILNRVEGLDLYLGQDGMALSGGQRQRLMLARIFVDEADVYILDEPFNGIDSITTNEIWKKVKETLKDKIVILIDHHFSDSTFFEYEYYMENKKLCKKRKEI